MATKAMSEMTDAEVKRARDWYLDRIVTFNSEGFPRGDYAMFLILANQYDAELTRRREGKTNASDGR